MVGELLTNMLGENEKLVLGKSYPEALSVHNSGTIDSYVRVVLYKSWTKDGETVTDTELSPDLIALNLTGNGWIEDKDASTPERMVLYYTSVLPSGGSGSIITHRVVENRVLPRELITRGDANQEQDRNPVPYTDFIGTVERSVPGAGIFAEIFTSRTGKMAASGLIAAAVLLYVLAGILEGNGGRRSWQQEVTENEEKI